MQSESNRRQTAHAPRRRVALDRSTAGPAARAPLGRIARSRLGIAVKRRGALLPFLLILLGFPAAAAAQGPLPPPIYFTRNFDFEEVDISTVAARLRSFGIPVPVALEGSATVNLSVGIPMNRLANARAYRLQGTISSPRLGIEGYLFGDVEATLSLEKGILTLPRLEGQLLDADAPDVSLGRFAGEAVASLLPLENFEAELAVENVDVSAIDQFIDAAIGDVAGTIGGTVTMTAPVDELGAPEAYTATANLSSPQLTYAGLGLANVSAAIRLDKGAARVTSLAGQLVEPGIDAPRGLVRGEATAQLIPLGDISFRGAIEGLDLSMLPRVARLAELQVAGAGEIEVTATVPLATADDLASWAGEGRLSVGPTVVAGRSIESAEVAFELAEMVFTADPVTIVAENVPLVGHATVRMADTDEQDRGWTAALDTEAAEVSDLMVLLVGASPAGSGGSLSLEIDAAGSLDGAGWQADAAVSGSSVHIAGFRVGDLAHRLQMTPESLSLTPTAEANLQDLLLRRLNARYAATEEAVTLEDLALEGWNGQLRGEAAWSLQNDGRHRAELDWSDFQFTVAGDAWGAAERTLQTMTSGHIDWAAPASELSRPAAHTFHLRAAADNMRSGEVPLGALRVTIDAAAAPWRLRGDGRLLEIPAQVSAVLRVAPDATWENLLRSPGSASLVAGPLPIDQLIARGSALLAAEPREPDEPVEPSETGEAGESIAVAPAERDVPWQGTAALRIDAATSPAGLRTGALLSIADLAYGDAPVADEVRVATQVELIGGGLRLSELRGEIRSAASDDPPVQFTGLAVVELSADGGADAAAETEPQVRRGSLALELSSRRVDLALLSPWLPADLGPFGGTAAVALRAAAPLDRLGDLAAWQGVGDVVLSDLRAAGRQIDTAAAEVVLRDRWISATQLELVAAGVSLSGRAAARVEPATASLGRWEALVRTDGAPIENLFSLLGGSAPEETAGTLRFTLEAAGDGGEGTWRVAGNLSSDAIRVAAFDLGSLEHELRIGPTELRLVPRAGADTQQMRLNQLSATYSVDERQWRLDDFRLRGWEGTLAGEATWSRTENQPHRAEISWTDLQLAIPGSVIGLGDRDVQTRTVGTLQWSAPPAELANPAAHRFTLEAGATEMRLGELAVGDLRLAVDAMQATWTIQGDGTLLQGPARLTATLRAGEAASWDQLAGVPVAATWVAGPMQVGNLFQLWQPAERAEDWAGQASLRWTAESDGDAPLRSIAQLSIDGLQYRNQLITDRLSIELASIGSRLDIRSVRGSYAGGRISGSGRWSLEPGPRQLALRLSSVDASRALLPLTAESGEWFDGLMSADLVIAGGGALRLSGQMELRNGVTFGVRSRSIRASLRGLVALPSLRWSLQLSNLRASQGRGRVTGSMRLEQSLARPNRVDMDSTFEATDLDFQEVLADQAGSTTGLGQGALTGTLTLRGRAIESIADVDGRLTARLGGTDAAAIPGLLPAQNYLGVLSIRNTRFTRGEIDARLRRGEMRINEFWASSDQLRVWADGRVSLRSGRIDVQAVAATGNFRESNAAILALAQRFALDAALPLGLVTQANELLSDRVVRLAIGGTYSRPSVRVQPGATLTQNAARFFLREAAGLAIPVAGAGAGVGAGAVGDDR